jgi:hypothetical protein
MRSSLAPLPRCPPEHTPPWWRSQTKDAIADVWIWLPPPPSHGSGHRCRSNRCVDPGTAAAAAVLRDGRGGTEATTVVEYHYLPAHVIFRLPVRSRLTALRVASATCTPASGPMPGHFSSRPCNGQSTTLSSREKSRGKGENELGLRLGRLPRFCSSHDESQMSTMIKQMWAVAK